jgi:hypothetical protein
MIPTLYIKLAVIGIAALLGFLAGWQVNGWRHDALALADMALEQRAIDASVAQAKLLIAERKAKTDTAALLDIERTRTAKTVERTVTNEIIKYVQTPAATNRCGLDSAGVRIINTAARVPADIPAGQPDAGTGAVTAAGVVQSVTTNYGICHGIRNQLLALQDWVRASGVGQ